MLTQRQVTGSATYALSYAYNLGGLLTSETYPSNRVVTNSYDEGARLSQVSDGTTTFANGFTYAPQGGLSSETLGNGMVHSLNYNRRLQASEVKLKQSAGGAELQRYNYAYGQVSQSDGSVDTSKNNGQIGKIDGYIGGAKQWDQRMSYDSLARLSTAAEYRGDNGQQSWQTQHTFDRFGNRFQSGSGNSNVSYIPVVTNDIIPATNRLTDAGGTPTTYDPAGNILTDTKFRSLKYNYDANGRQTAAKLLDNTNLQSSIYDCAGQRVQTTAGSVTRTMVYDIFGQDVADYTGSSGATLERENIYRGGQLLATETPVTTAPTALAASPSGGGASIALSWAAAPGATNYRIERKAAGGSYTYLGATANISFTDNGVSSGSAYLYQVCAANGQNNCTTNYTNVALGAAITFPTDPTITSIVDDPSGVNVTTMKAEHITELRTAVNAVRSLAGLSAAAWTHPTLTAQVTEISKDDVVDLRVKLDEALTVLGIQTSTYTDATLAGAPNGTLIRAAHIRELRQRATSGTGIGGGGSSGGLQYVLSDLQGSTRAVMNNNGAGTSTIIARHDYLPFGEEIGSGTGLRTTGQGYGSTDTNRKKYGMLERDSSTGLDHAWFRKFESFSGRWTSPDPLGGGNAYSYAGNDPVNFVDPSGLRQCQPGDYGADCDSSGFGGWGGGSLAGNGWGSDPHPGRGVISGERRYSTYYPDRNLIVSWTWAPYPELPLETSYFSWAGFFPQNPNVGGGRTTDRATEKKDDPCEGVKSSDLKYDKVRKYKRNKGMEGQGRYVSQTSEQHIRNRHMNPASAASQYYGSFHAVQNTNAYTFDFGTRTTDTTGTNIYFELNFHLPIVGTDRDEGFSPTGYNTLILENDCRTVVTSHPGRAWH